MNEQLLVLLVLILIFKRDILHHYDDDVLRALRHWLVQRTPLILR